jgi:DNA-binding FrmR family transcriptional regulator
MSINQKSHDQLVNNIIGQLNGVKRMLDGKADCLDVLVQLKAARSALDALNAKILAGNVMSCAQPKTAKDRVRLEQLIKQLTK